MKTIAEPQLHLWNRYEYYLMAEMGMFTRKHVELIEGQVIEMSPQGTQHITSVTLVGDLFRRVFVSGFFVRIQGPLNLGEHSEPEPDVAVVSGSIRDYNQAHPTTAVLVVEISDTSLNYDRTHKARLYAKAGIAEYWIVNLISRQLEVYRDIISDEAQLFGFGYRSIMFFTETDFVTPLVMPNVSIAVADLLP